MTLLHTVGQVTPLGAAHWMSKYTSAHPARHVILTDTQTSAHNLAQALRLFTGNRIPVIVFPDRETLPYDRFSPPEDLTSERLAILHQLPSISHGIWILSINTAMNRLPPATYLDAHRFSLNVGDRFDVIAMRSRLELAGYRSAKHVMIHGEYALRGALFDIFPMGSDRPFRIDLFDDEIESIRHLDVETQRSGEPLDHFELLPAHEFPLTEEACQFFETQWQQRFSKYPKSPVIQAVKHQRAIGGLEYYLPCFFKAPTSFLDHLGSKTENSASSPSNTLVWRMPGLQEAGKKYWQQILDRYQTLHADPDYPALLPDLAFLSLEAVFTQCNQFSQIHLQTEPLSKESPQKHNLPDQKRFELPSLAPLTGYAWIREVIQSTPYRVVICAESLGRATILKDHLTRQGLSPHTVDSWSECLKTSERLLLIIAQIDGKWFDPDWNGWIIGEPTLFGFSGHGRSPSGFSASRSHLPGSHLSGSKTSDPSMTGPKDLGNLPSHQDTPLIFHDLSELQIGECVVHIDHGIGRYQGLTTLDMNGQTAEFLTLLYQNDDKLYVPLEDLNRLSPYTHVNPEQVQLHKLGTDRWSKSKEKALGRMRDAAADLLALYAARSLQLRKPYELNLEDYEAFSAQFPYTETEDQSRAIQAILQDMTSPHPMDRVLCGDVGFGKTEVALRAAFIAVTNHHQVAVLVPTTLLCQQHFENFQERFAQWPIKIESMSRFKTAHQLAQVKADLHAGKIDIVIGTHALLSSDVHFASLGLVIVDEEHRFGVRHKEQLKKLRHQIDILSMTATPIPRTLNMALSGVRDLSIISTPPAKRLSVQTFVREYHPDIIKEAILREIYRGGQVYFLHNEVDTIQHQRDLLTQLLPDVRCEIAHGQMPERQLERLMHDFYHNRFQVLLCTTIIETGIDVQNANTIIMNRADRLGLAQMHQLRGRVGRSYHQAYAYLLTPPIDTLPTDAKKRLEALCDANSLGAGFTLAQHDLDIRGAGALLGEEQSGQIEAMGYELYIDLLQVTTRALQRGEALDYETLLNKHTTQIDLGIPHLFPETYMADIHLRLKYYQQLARVLSDTDIYHIKSEVIDRFGKLPEPSEALFALTELRVYAAARGITHISGHRQSIKITFAAPPHCAVDPAKIISMIQRHPQKYKLAGSQALSILGDFQTPAARLQAVKESLEALFQHP